MALAPQHFAEPGAACCSSSSAWMYQYEEVSMYDSNQIKMKCTPTIYKCHSTASSWGLGHRGAHVCKYQVLPSPNYGATHMCKQGCCVQIQTASWQVACCLAGGAHCNLVLCTSAALLLAVIRHFHQQLCCGSLVAVLQGQMSSWSNSCARSASRLMRSHCERASCVCLLWSIQMP